MKKLILSLALLLLLTSPTLAQDEMSHMDHAAVTITQADAMTKMHEAMNQPTTGDADADFIRGMIPHHQGAIDMAKVVLAEGKDADVKNLAQNIIRAQENEITWMRAWLAKRNIPETGEYKAVP